MMQDRQQIQWRLIKDQPQGNKMNQLIEKIINREFEEANKLFESEIISISERKIVEMKKMIAAKMNEAKKPAKPAKTMLVVLKDPKTQKGIKQKAGGGGVFRLPEKKFNPKIHQPVSEQLDGISRATEKLGEEDTLEEATRIKIVRARIRGGKIQRRKRVSNVPGMTLRGGRLIRMSPAERRRRKMGQRRGKLKRRAKKNQMLRRRKLSLIKRRRLGV